MFVGANLDHASELLEQLKGCKTIGQDPEGTPEILAARLDEIREDVAASERDLEAGNPRAGLERASAADDQARELVAALEKALAEGTCP